MKIIKANTFLGRVLTEVIRFLLSIIGVFKGRVWSVPPIGFHDDPLRFTFKDILFFAYKYYLRPPVKDERGGEVERYFQTHAPDFELGDGFIELSRVSLTAAGDLMPYEWVKREYCAHLWDDIGDDFFGSDVRFANLETPIDVSQAVGYVPEMMLSDMHFNGDEEMFGLFEGGLSRAESADYSSRTESERYTSRTESPNYSGFDVLSTANNHSLDMGESGLRATLDFLDERGVLPTGTARSDEERWTFPVIERNGIRIAFIAYTYSLNKFTPLVYAPWAVNYVELNQPGVDVSGIKGDVAHSKTALGADIVVLSLHFGNAYQAFPGGHVVDNVERIFSECGPDVILGSHPHNIQPMAKHSFSCPITGATKTGLVVYSMGDFIAYDIFSWCHLPVYLKIVFSKGIEGGVEKIVISGVEAIPVYVCGVYKGARDRSLRLLDARRLVKKIGEGDCPSFMSKERVKELEGLMD